MKLGISHVIEKEGLGLAREQIKTSIGGEALIEGIMMKGPKVSAMANRLPDGSIDLELLDFHPIKEKVPFLGLPLIQGSVNFIEMMLTSYKCLNKSVQKVGLEDEEPSAFEKKLTKLFGDKFAAVLTGVSAVLGMLLAVGLFLVLPTVLVKLLGNWLPITGVASLIEGVVKLGIFVLYLALVSHMPEMARLFGYHGAEHKTIACYEAGEELTVENIRKHRRFHPRCGTSFLLITLVISILASSIVTWESALIRVGLKLLMLPLVMGVSYEIIRFAGRHDNAFTRIISAPGLWLQRLTTKEPDDGMIEIAIAAVTPVIPTDGSDRI